MQNCIPRLAGLKIGENSLGPIITLLSRNLVNQKIQSKRGLPARGTKPLPRLLWDKKHLEELTDGNYTHLPLRVKRLGGRDPITGHKVFIFQ